MLCGLITQSPVKAQYILQPFHSQPTASHLLEHQGRVETRGAGRVEAVETARRGVGWGERERESWVTGQMAEERRKCTRAHTYTHTRKRGLKEERQDARNDKLQTGQRSESSLNIGGIKRTK